MENWIEIKRESDNANERFEASYSELCKLLSEIDNKELLAMLGLEYYSSFLCDELNDSPAIMEYIAGLCITTEHTDCRPITEQDYMHIKALSDSMAHDQMSINWYGSLNEDDDEYTVKMKQFAGNLKTSYSFARGYSWYRKIEESNIRELFGDFKNEVERLIGFYPSDAYIVTDSFANILYDRFRDSISVNKTSDGHIFAEALEKKPLDIMLVKKEELFQKCEKEITREHFDAFLQYFSCELENNPCEKTMYFTDDNYFSFHPIIDLGDSVLIIDHQIILWNLRECIEESIKGNIKEWNKYEQNYKAAFLEKKSAELIKRILPQCDIYTGLYYMPQGSETACELDVLAVYDSIIILVEAKSGVYSRPARRGGLKRLEKVIERNIQCAFEQADRTRNYILQTSKPSFYYDSRLSRKAISFESNDISDVLIINTTLDYYAELGVDMYKLKEFNLYKGEEFPWTVCISDLEVISDFMDFPNQFLYYTYFRCTFNNLLSEKNGALSIYELDLLAMYKLENTELFNKYNISTAEDEGYVAKDFTNYFRDFYTEYYFTNKKPVVQKKRYNEKFIEMVRQLEEYNTKGFSFFILRFLDLDLDDQDRLMKQIEESCKRTEKDFRVHEFTYKEMPRHFFRDKYGLVMFAAYEKDRQLVEEHARYAGAVQQGLKGTTHWISLVIFLDDDRHYINQFYFYLGDDSITEELKKGTAHCPRSVPIKIYPNDPCPCGSGKKYKKCHG